MEWTRKFSERLGHYYGELDALHPFRKKQPDAETVHVRPGIKCRYEPGLVYGGSR